MKKRKYFVVLSFMFVLLLSGCKENTNSAEQSSATVSMSQPDKESEGQIQETAIPEEESASGMSETVAESIPEDYAMSIVVTINPKIKLYLDTNQVILGVEYLNEDAKSAFSDIDFSGNTIDEGMEKIVEAAVENQFLTSGKEVNIDITEIKDETCDSQAVCEAAETAVIAIAKENHIEAVVSAQVSAQVVIPEQPQETVPTKEAEAKPEQPQETASEPVPEVTPEPAPETICNHCGGTGKCDECKGDGYRGNGYTVSCPRCHGSFTGTCIYCDADGNSIKHEGKCDFPNCMGSHKYACTTCNGGTSAVTCASCNGSGKCKVCGGSGQ